MRLLRLHPPLMITSALMLAVIVVGSAGLFLDDRVLLGLPIWLKPLKFAISIVIYGTTLAWMISLLTRGRRLGSILGTIIAVGMFIEEVIIVGQAVRGRRSHFNVETTGDTVLWAVMAGSIAFVWLATAGIGILALRERISDRPAALAIRAGLLVSLVGMAVAFLMTSPTDDQLAQLNAGGGRTTIGAHSVGVPDGGPGLPLVNWSTTGGDYRVGHFIGLHALQALPLVALALALLARRIRPLRDERARTRLVGVLSAAYLGLTVLVTWQAMRGQSLIHPDGPTIAVAGGLLVAAVAGTAWAVTATPRPAPMAAAVAS